MASEHKDIYFNEFFEGYPKLPKEELDKWIEENKRRKKTFVEYPSVSNLTRRDVWEDRAKFYFLPFLINCYRFTRKNELPMFAIPVSPTCMFHRDRLHLRNFMDTIHKTFFRCLDMCIPEGENIMLMVEKRFHVVNPVDGGTQQLYNMLWDCDLSPVAGKVILPSNAQVPVPRIGLSHEDTSWGWDVLNPDMPESGLDLCRRTCWLEDDLLFLCKRYDLIDECHFPEVVDLTQIPEEKHDAYSKTAREFYFKVFQPKDYEDEEEEEEPISSDSDLYPDDDEMELDSTQLAMLDSTLDFEEDDSKMKKIIAFFAKMPKVTGLIQGMMDMMVSLTRILPLVIVKLDEGGDEEGKKLKPALQKTVDILNIGLDKILRICAYLGIKVGKKPNGAIGQIVKNRFKKDKKDFLEYEIDELNKYIDHLEGIDDDDDDKKKHPGQIPIMVKEEHLYPQKMPLRPGPHPHPDQAIVVPVKNGIPLDKDGKPLPPPPAKIKWITDVDKDNNKRKNEDFGGWRDGKNET